MRNKLEEELGWKFIINANERIAKECGFKPEIEYCVGSEEKDSIVYSPQSDYFSNPERQKIECERWLKEHREKYPNSQFSHPSYIAWKREYYPLFHLDWNLQNEATKRLLGKPTMISSDINENWKAIHELCLTGNKPNQPKFFPPYRVGRKQGRAVLDSTGHEVGLFRAGSEAEAQMYCDFLNNNNRPIELELKNNELVFSEPNFEFFKKQFDESFSKVSPEDFVNKFRKLGYIFADVDPEQPTIDDYKEVIQDHKRLVKELDVALNGKDAAEQASLCDIVSQVKGDNKLNPEKWIEFIEWISTEDDWHYYPTEKMWKMDGWGSRTTIQLFELYHKKH